MPRRLTQEEIQTICTLRNITLLRYGGNCIKLSRFKCNIDDYEWDASFANVKWHNSGCPKCAGNLPLTLEEVKQFCLTKNIELVRYGGGVDHMSRFRCLKDGHEWETRLNSLRSHNTGCPHCHIRWKYKEVTFDSSWELIFYLYHISLGSNILRLERHLPEHCFKYKIDEKEYKWYPDFIVDDIYYEIKPDNGGRYYRKHHTPFRKAAYPNIKWIGDAEIKRMREIVGDIAQYEVK